MMSMAEQPPRRSPWPWAIGAFLTVVIAVNIAFIWVANRNAPQLAEQDYYQAGLKYEEQIQMQRNALALGWTADVQTCPDGLTAEGCAITLKLADAKGQPIEGLSGAVTARRADDASLDTTVRVQALGSGVYRATLPVQVTGKWKLLTRLKGGQLDGQAVPWVNARPITIRPGAGQ